jgi:hypothetical protein
MHALSHTMRAVSRIASMAHRASARGGVSRLSSAAPVLGAIASHTCTRLILRCGLPPYVTDLVRRSCRAAVVRRMGESSRRANRGRTRRDAPLISGHTRIEVNHAQRCVIASSMVQQSFIDASVYARALELILYLDFCATLNIRSRAPEVPASEVCMQLDALLFA